MTNGRQFFGPFDNFKCAIIVDIFKRRLECNYVKVNGIHRVDYTILYKAPQMCAGNWLMSNNVSNDTFRWFGDIQKKHDGYLFK